MWWFLWNFTASYSRTPGTVPWCFFEQEPQIPSPDKEVEKSKHLKYNTRVVNNVFINSVAHELWALLNCNSSVVTFTRAEVLRSLDCKSAVNLTMAMNPILVKNNPLVFQLQP